MPTWTDGEEWEDSGIAHSDLGELLLGHSPSRRRRCNANSIFKAYYGSLMPAFVPNSSSIIRWFGV